MRTMSILALACLIAAAAAAPATYDQRQDGGFNVRADVQNVVFVVAYPSKMTLPLLSGLMKSAKQPDAQERADIRVMEAFVEPSEPYHVEIGEAGRAAEAEVVIAGRRRLDGDSAPQAELGAEDEYKLLGATEQCGPDRERDPDTLMCRARAAPAPAPAPAPVQPTPAPAQPAQPQSQEKPQVTADRPSPEIVPASS